MSPSFQDRAKATWQRIPLWGKSGLSICLTALLTTGIKDMWDAPRPRVDITSCGIGLTHPAQFVSVPGEIVTAFANHQYLPDIEREVTAGDLHEILTKSEQEYRNFLAAEAYFDELIALVNTQSVVMNRDARRLQFLKTMDGSPHGEVVEQQTKFTLDEYERHLPLGYDHHPKDVQGLRVNMGTSIFSLREIDEEAAVAQVTRTNADLNAGERVRLEVRRANLYRRILAIYDPNVVVGVLTAARDEMHGMNEVARQSLDRLRSILAKEAPSGWKVTALVTNRGGRALTVLRTGVLAVEVPGIKTGANGKVLVDLEAPDTTGDEFIVVEAQKAAILRLVSKQPLDSLIARQRDLLGGSDWKPGAGVDASRLMRLYSARVGDLKAKLLLARAGSTRAGERVGGSASFPIGRKWEESVLEKLRE